MYLSLAVDIPPNSDQEPQGMGTVAKRKWLNAEKKVRYCVQQLVGTPRSGHGDDLEGDTLLKGREGHGITCHYLVQGYRAYLVHKCDGSFLIA